MTINFHFVLSVLFFLILGLIPCAANAQVEYDLRPKKNDDAVTDFYQKPNFSYSEKTDPEFPVVTFKKMAKPVTLEEWLELIVQGILTDVPPEYDYYGYEIRRYMAKIGSEDIYGIEARLAEEAENINNARAIMEHWNRHLMRHIEYIRQEIETQNASATIRSTYKYNAAVIQKFQIDIQRWFDANEVLLDFLAKERTSYKIADGVLTFNSSAERGVFKALIDARNKARDIMNEYHSFSMMAY
jgi:hypothetical protein